MRQTFAVLDTYALNNDGTRDHMEQITLKGPHILRQAARRVGLGSKDVHIRNAGRSAFGGQHTVILHCGLGRDGLVKFFF